MYATYHALSWLLLLCYVSDSGDNVDGGEVPPVHTGF